MKIKFVIICKVKDLRKNLEDAFKDLSKEE
jgi:hypothetical protein